MTQPAPHAPFVEHLAWARTEVKRTPPPVQAFEYGNLAQALALLSWRRPDTAAASEALYFDNAPVAHVVAYQERQRLARIERDGRKAVRAAMNRDRALMWGRG